MLTDDKKITTPEYWNKVYQGKNDNAAVDASNTVRPANTFDRFSWVAALAEGPNVLEVAAGHAHISKRIKAVHPEWYVAASDQAEAAKKVAKYEPYFIHSAYAIPVPDKSCNTIIACQCLEYMDDLHRFFNEAKRVADYLIFTVPLGTMSKWSQLYVFTFENVAELIHPHYGESGSLMHWEKQNDLLLVKIKFNA